MFSILKFLLKINICTTMSSILNIMVKFPNVSGKLKLKIYGIDEMDDVLRLAFVTKLTPSAFINNPTKSKRYLLNLFIACMFFLFFDLFCENAR